MDIQNRNRANNPPLLPRTGGNQDQSVRNAAQQLDKLSKKQQEAPNARGNQGSNDIVQNIINLIQRFIAQMGNKPTPKPTPTPAPAPAPAPPPPNIQPVYGAVIPPNIQPVYGAVIPPNIQPVYGAVIPPNIQPVYGAVIPPTPPNIQPVYGAIVPSEPTPEPIGAQPVYGTIRAPADTQPMLKS